MFSLPTLHFRFLSLALAASLIATGLASGGIALAGEMDDHAESLKGVPADASFYAAWLKNGEQIERMQETNAWRKLMTIPAVQMGIGQLRTYWQYPPDDRLAAVIEWIDGSDGQEVLELLKEMGSEEIFIYGDRGVTDLLEVFVEANSEVSRAQFEGLRNFGDLDAVDPEEAMKEKIAKLLEKHQDKLKIPSLVIGFRIDDTDRASELLSLLEEQLRQLAAGAPIPIDDVLKRVESDNIDLLTLTVTGDMLPWDDIELEMDDQPELLDLLREIVEDKQAVLAVGVVEGFVIISISDSIDGLKELGEGPLLADTPEFERLDRHADEEVVSIMYASGDFLRVANSNERSFQDIAVMVKGLMSMADLDPLRRELIEKDIDELAADIIEYLPEPGAIAAVSFMTDRGYESFAYNWGEMAPNYDGTKKLTLIDHLGEDSIGWFVARGKQSVEGYDKAVSWIKRGHAHFEAIAETEMGHAEWKQYLEVREKSLPLLARIDEANREMLIPGFADGQGAIVFEASAADKDWCDFIPTAGKDLPLPTIAIVQGVSDAALVKEGANVYLDVAQEAIDMAHKAAPDEVPAFAIPAPEESEVSGGTIYSYALPSELAVNERIAPNAGINDSVLVLSLLPELTETLLEGSRPTVDGPAAEFDRPLLAAGHFKFAKFLDVFSPWIDYGIQIAMEQQDEDAAMIIGMVGFVKPQVDQVLDVLKVFDSGTWTLYHEDDAWVTHGELRIIDLED